MTIAALLRAELVANGAVAALVSTRVYPRFLPQNPTYPALTYLRVSNSGQLGSTVLRRSRWQVDCWGTTESSVQSVAAAVKAALEEWSDVDQTPGVKMTEVIGEVDDYEPDTEIFRTSIDVMLTTTGD